MYKKSIQIKSIILENIYFFSLLIFKMQNTLLVCLVIIVDLLFP